MLRASAGAGYKLSTRTSETTGRINAMRHPAIGLALALLCACGGSALAADATIELKLSHWIPPAHPLHPAFQAWAADIEKASGGTIKSTIFPAQQLGKAVDHYDM